MTKAERNYRIMGALLGACTIPSLILVVGVEGLLFDQFGVIGTLATLGVIISGALGYIGWRYPPFIKEPPK